MKLLSHVALAVTILAGCSVLAHPLGEPVRPTAAVEAKQMIGANAVVVGKVAEVHKSDKAISLNVDFNRETGHTAKKHKNT